MNTILPQPLPNTLMEAIRYFAAPMVAIKFFAGIRWPDGKVVCPHCGHDGANFLHKYGRWECRNRHPRRQFTVKVGTVMEDSPIALDKWAVAFWLEVNAKNSISSYEMHRALGITQKSAWFLQQRIRLAVQSGSFQKMSGGVEIDETFIGGQARFMHKHKKKRVVKGTGGHLSGKAAVMGLLDRHTREVRTVVLDSVKKKAMHGHVKANVAPGSTLYTDAYASYVGLSPEYVHNVIDHAECYVKGEVHTNGLENFWSLFKRCIKGNHVSVEPFHLFRYLDAECFRFNNRKQDDLGRFLLAVLGLDGKRLTYKQLIGKVGSEGHPTTAAASDSREADGSDALPN